MSDFGIPRSNEKLVDGSHIEYDNDWDAIGNLWDSWVKVNSLHYITRFEYEFVKYRDRQQPMSNYGTVGHQYEIGLYLDGVRVAGNRDILKIVDSYRIEILFDRPFLMKPGLNLRMYSKNDRQGNEKIFSNRGNTRVYSFGKLSAAYEYMEPSLPDVGICNALVGSSRSLWHEGYQYIEFETAKQAELKQLTLKVKKGTPSSA